jgi:uncharacterized RDD family membrane protein YckC
MAKVRFRDLKHGKIPTDSPKKDRRTPPSAPPYPDKRTRAKAFVTDSFMLLMPIMYIVFYLVMGGREGFAANKLLGWIDILVPLMFVQIAFLAKSGQTPGMRAYNIRLVDHATHAAPRFGQIVVRQILAPFSRLALGWVLMFLRADHRMPHELLSGTALIMTDDPARKRPAS